MRKHPVGTPGYWGRMWEEFELTVIEDWEEDQILCEVEQRRKEDFEECTKKSSQDILCKRTNCNTARSISPISETQEPGHKFGNFKLF